MTNRQKFIEVFGYDPDCGGCNPYRCDEGCEWKDECANTPGASCSDWWEMDYHKRGVKK